MLNKLEQAQAKWGGTSQLIDAWLTARQQLLISYCQLAGMPPYEKKDAGLPCAEAIQRFCEQLVDYVSTGHFEVYEQIIRECAENAAQLSEILLPKITETTEIALSFNDKYADTSAELEFTGFDQDLSDLGQTMEARFAIEDQLVDMLHRHSSED